MGMFMLPFCGKWLTKSFSASSEYKIKLETKKQQKKLQKTNNNIYYINTLHILSTTTTEMSMNRKKSTFSTLYPIKEIINRQNI